MKCSKKLSKAIALSLMVSQAVGSYPVRAESQEVPIAVQNVQSQGENGLSEGTELEDTHDNAEDMATDETQDSEKTETTEKQQENGMATEENPENEIENPSETEEVEGDSTTDDTTKPDIDGTNTDNNNTVTNETQDSEKIENTEEQQDQKEETKQDDLLKNEKKTKALLSEQGMSLEKAKETWEIEENDGCYIIKGNKQASDTITMPTYINGKSVKIASDFSITWGDGTEKQFIIKEIEGHKLTFNSNDELKTFIQKLNIKKSYGDPDISLSLDLTGVDVSNITDMSGLFSYGIRTANTLSNLDISNWNTSKVTNMSHMFETCYQLTSINFGDKFNTSQVKNMNSMFSGCNQLENVTSLSNWDVSNVEDMGALFLGTKLVNVNNLYLWNTKSVINMARMFNNCISLEDVSGLKEWDVSNVKDMAQMFANCATLSDINILLSNWNLTNVNNISGFLGMVGYPYGKNNECIESIDFPNRWGEKFKPKYIHAMIMGFDNLKKVNLSGWDTSNTGFVNIQDDMKDLSGILNNCKKLEYLDLSGWTLTPSIEDHDKYNKEDHLAPGVHELFKIESENLRCIDFTLNDTISKENVDRVLFGYIYRSNPLLIISNQKSILEYEHIESWGQQWKPCIMTFKTKDGKDKKEFKTYALKDRTEKTLNATIDAMKEAAKELLSEDEQKRWIGWKVENNDDVAKSRMSTLSMKKLEKNEEKLDPNNLPLEYLYSELQKTYIPVFTEDAPILEVGNKTVIEGTTFDREVALKDVTATTNDKQTDLKSKVQVDVDSVNTSKPGEYELTYTVTDDGITISKTITVTVWGKPNIEAGNKTIVQGEVFDEEKALEKVTAQAHDKTDITKDIQVDLSQVDTSKAGTYEVTYTVTDHKGATTSKTIQLEVLKPSVTPPITPDPIEEEVEEVVKKKPTIQAEDKTIGLNEEFKPLEGVTATDGEEKDITDKIVVTKNEVDTKKPGKYEVTYEVSDKDGETVSKTITVEVKKPQKEKDKQKNKEKEDWKNPILEADDKEVVVGKTIDLLEDIVAKDWKGNDINDSVEIIYSNVDFNKPGSYEVTYEVTDNKGYKTKHTIQVVVREPGMISSVKKKQGKAKTKNTVHTIHKKETQKQTRRADQVRKGMKQSIYEEEGKRVLQLPKTLDKLPITYLYSGLLGSFLGIVYFLRKKRE